MICKDIHIPLFIPISTVIHMSNSYQNLYIYMYTNIILYIDIYIYMYYRISKIQIYRYTMMCIRTNIMIEFLGQLGQERWSTRDSTTPMTPCLSNKKICKEQMFTYKHISSYHILSLCIKSHGATLLGHFCTTGLDALPQRAKKPDNAGFSLHTRWVSHPWWTKARVSAVSKAYLLDFQTVA